MRRIIYILVGVVSALALAGCGGNSTSTNASGGDHNGADVMFAQQMIPHHEQAIEMAKLAPLRADSAEVKALATQIEAAQDPEINQMRGWLTAWKEPMSMDMGSGIGHGSGSGMMSGGDMTKLQGLTGKAFDREFLTMMVAHHQGAIEMAHNQQAQGKYPPAKALAASIIRTQSAEITTMHDLLKSTS